MSAAVSISDRKKPRSLVCLIPLGKGRNITWETMQMIRQCDELFASVGVPFTAIKVSDFDQAQARDELIARWASQSTFEDALFLDSDISTDPQFVLRVASLQEELLVVPYQKHDTKGDSANDWTIDTAGEHINVEIREGKRMLRVRGSGLGFTRLRRSVLGKLFAKYGNERSLTWTSHHPESPGLPVVGYCTPLVTEHPDGSDVWRRRPEDMSFYARCIAAGVTPYALCDVPVWHDARGGRTLLDGLLEGERRRRAQRRRVDLELAECPDDLLGLADVLDGAYEIIGLEIPNPVILDIGANIGAFSVWARSRFPGCAIESYEPHPGMFEVLRRNSPPSIGTLHNAAVSNAKAAKLYDGPNNQGERTLHPIPGIHLSSFTEVKTVPPSALPKCDILKIDTEGCEKEILQNYRHLRDVKAVMTEWHSVEDYFWIRQYLSECGFVCVVDRARGQPSEHRELCFVRKGVMVDAPRD